MKPQDLPCLCPCHNANDHKHIGMTLKTLCCEDCRALLASPDTTKGEGE